ncbi:putative 6-phosphofructo-2-kinase/fructose-2,6-biphosphatase [Trypanosoma cruzi]|nr:hypothetical protein BCY84_15340 [Trypanosoma cruzi cruzi]PWU95101.1 hypothetical protein C4B63_23g24 [Trypanosoma cruzi]RNF24425.1 putative 6-phosphofructo-2-kinase/fructose-2,6-biphosphatase [Trypanosoma cruzi]
MVNLDNANTQLGLDVYFPGCDTYYQQSRPAYLPYMDGSLYKPWQPRHPWMQSAERQRRDNPSTIEEACVYGSLAHVITFWAQGHEVKDRRALFEGNDATLLMWSALRGHLGVAKFLVDQGVKVNAANGLGHTALHWAVTGVQYDMTRFLLDHGADPRQKDHQGYSAYFTAVQANNLPLLLMLCEQHPIDPQERDFEGHSLLHWAAYTNSLVIFQYLVENCRFDLDVPDLNGRTPLLWAAREGYAVILEYLVLRGARTDLADKDNYTALQYARFRNHREAVYVLTKAPIFQRNDSTFSVKSDFSPMEISGSGYINVRQMRRRGTLKMMVQEPIFMAMSLLGIFYMAFSYLLLKFIPPLISHIVLGIFFFRNSLWMLILGYPVQGGKPELSFIQKMGIGNSFGESARGIWLFRNRDGSCLFAIMSFWLLQQYAWAKMGLVPIITSYPTYEIALKDHPLESVYQPTGSIFLGLFFNNKAELEGFLLLFLFSLMMLSCIMCKLLSMRSMYEPSESSLKNSPVWAIMRQRAYGWLHPRVISIEKHMLIPLRTFYCYERDVFFRRFDGYSIALECPIAESNHGWFFLFVTSAACFQWLIFFWAWEQTSERLQCPRYSSFSSWVAGSLWNLIIHALPCRDGTRLGVADYGPWVSWLQYVLPTEANYLGVWLLQYGLVASIMATFVAVRQWVAAANGATCIELANPTATGSEGGLVSIFPPTISFSAPWLPPEGITEGVTLPVDDGTVLHSKARKKNSRCIYADYGNALLNIFLFCLGRSGRRWRGAVAVSPSNAPLFTLSALGDSFSV